MEWGSWEKRRVEFTFPGNSCSWNGGIEKVEASSFVEADVHF